MDAFAIIPVLDLKNGIVVQARGGDRARYAPIDSPFGPATDPLGIARALLAITGSPALYLADLDAIEGTGDHFDTCRRLVEVLPGVALWIDAGIRTIASVQRWLKTGATAIIGSETLPSAARLTQLTGLGGTDLILSLDFKDRRLQGPSGLLERPQIWPATTIAMNLTRIGTNSGPDIECVKGIVKVAEGRSVFAAGGVRDMADIEALAEIGAKGALVASALHAQAITQKEIAALQRRRRFRS